MATKILTNIYENDKFYELKMMINGHRVNKSFSFTGSKSSKDKALAKAIAFKKATQNSFKKHEAPLDKNPDKVNFLGLYELYKPELLKLKGGENTTYLIDKAEEIIPFLLTTIVSNLSEETFKKVVNKLLDYGYAKSTVNKYLSLFSMVLKHAKDSGFNVENYAIGLQYSETELDNRLDEVVSREELKTIINEVGSETAKLAIEFLFHTATRRSEVIKARFEDVDFTKDKETLKLYDTKNGKNHLVILDKTAVKIIKKLQKINGDGYIFQSDNPLNKQDGNRFQKDVWTRAWRRAVKRINERTGEAKWLRKKLHTLRHSRITEYVTIVPNLIALQEITGHKDIRSLKRYSHTSVEARRGFLGKFAKE